MLRDTIEIGSGDASIELDIDSSTLEHFLSIVESGTFTIYPRPNVSFLAQVLALAEFLHKFACAPAIELFLHVCRERAAKGTDWPQLALFLVGILLGRPQVCADTFDLNLRRWKDCSQWKVPDGVSLDLRTVDPRSFSYEIHSQIPAPHLWALTRGATLIAGKQNAEPHLPVMAPSERFMHYFVQCTFQRKRKRPNRER